MQKNDKHLVTLPMNKFICKDSTSLTRQQPERCEQRACNMQNYIILRNNKYCELNKFVKNDEIKR